MADNDTMYTLADIKDYFRGCRDNATGTARKRFEKYIEAVESAMEAGASTTIEETEEQEESEEDCGKAGYVSVADAMKAAAKAYAPLMKKMSSKQRKKPVRYAPYITSCSKFL